MNMSEIEAFEKKVKALEELVELQVLEIKKTDVQICVARMNGDSDDEIRILEETNEICKEKIQETEKNITLCKTKLGIARLEEIERLSKEERSWVNRVKSFFFSHP